MREKSDSSDFDIFFVPSRKLMTRVPGPVMNGSGKRKEIRGGEIGVEFLRDVARQLQMLFLVLADRHMGCAIGENVRRHQIGVGKQSDRCIFAVFSRLVLELRHAVEPADPGHAIEDPGQFRMFGNLRLVEQNRPFRVDSRREAGGCDFTRGSRTVRPGSCQTVIACMSTTQ